MKSNPNLGDFNTSNVTIQRSYPHKSAPISSNFNTSNVTIQHEREY